MKITFAQSALAANTTENSLIISLTTAALVAQGLGGNTLQLTSGGLILSNTGTIGSAVNDGSLTTGTASQDLYIFAGNNTGVIKSSIIDNGSAVTLNKFGGSTLTLSGTSSYSGGTNIEQGALTVASTGSTGAVVMSAGATTLTNNGVVGNITTSAVGGGTITNNGTAGNITTGAGGGVTINLAGGSTTGSISLNSTLAANTLTVTGATALTVGAISGPASGGLSNITYTNTFAGGNTLGFAAGANSFGTVTDSPNSKPLTLGLTTGTTSFGTVTNNSTAGVLTLSSSSSGVTSIGTLNGASGSTIAFGGDGTGTTTISNILNTPGQTVQFNSGVVNLFGSGQFNTTMIVNGATVNTPGTTSNSTNFTRLPNLQVLSGTLNVAEVNGLRVGTDFGTGQSTTNSSADGQSGGAIVFTNGSGLSLGGKDGAFTNTFSLSGGIFNGSAANSFLSIDANTSGTGYSSFNLSGGTLLLNNTIAGVAGTGAAQSFIFTGGTLAVTGYNATNLTSATNVVVSATTNTLTNAGGVLAPGDVGTAGRPRSLATISSPAQAPPWRSISAAPRRQMPSRSPPAIMIWLLFRAPLPWAAS